jgi:hypothetical protein
MKRLVTLLLILAMTVTFAGCHRETDEQKIKKIITDIQTAAEVKDVNEIINNVSKTYKDPQGFNYETIKGLLVGYFLQYPKVSVYINDLEISVENTISARAVFQTVLTSGNKTGSIKDIIPQSLGMYDFDVSLTKESDGWKVITAKWELVDNENVKKQ